MTHKTRTNVEFEKRLNLDDERADTRLLCTGKV